MRLRHYLLALGWAVVILFGTLLPSKALPPSPDWELLSFDSLVHAILFGTQLFLLLFGLRRDASVSFSRKIIFKAFLAVVTYGILIEFMQGAMGMGRMADPADAISNTVGSFVGLAAWKVFASRF